MSRSKWKFPITSYSKKKNKVWNRNLLISQAFVNKNITVYNGKNFFKIKLIKEHCGYKMGEFAFTRKFTPKKTKNIR